MASDPITVRRFGLEGGGRPVVMLHGLQSHSGWFVQSARTISDEGHPVHAYDRCGSGASEYECDGGAHFTGLLNELDVVVDGALETSAHDSVYVLGHCFGAIPALLYAALHRPRRVAGVVLATPALYTHTDLGPLDKARVLWSVLTGRPGSTAVPLAPEQFSERLKFVEFVRGDASTRKRFPARFLYELARARRRLPEAVRSLRAPLLVAFAGDDPICDNARVRRLLDGVSATIERQEYVGARHILEFSMQRDAFFADLSRWLQHRESG